MPFDIMVPSTSDLGRPIWTGSEYLLLVQAHPGVIQRIAADGTIGQTFMLGSDVTTFGEPYAWTGSELGVIFSTGTSTAGSFTLARFGAEGSPIGTSTVATDVLTSVPRALRWAGDRYLLGWSQPTHTTGYTATLEEVSADGVPGMTSTVSGNADTMYGLTTNAATHLASIGQPNGPLSFVAIDRATGTVSQHTAPYGVNGAPLIAREHAFVAYAPEVLLPSNHYGPALEVIDATGMATTTIPIPNVIVADMVAMSYGYHLVTGSTDSATNDQFVQDVDLGPDGTQLGAVNTRGTIPAGTGSTIPTVTSRGNGLLTVWATGPNTQQMTARLIQDCLP